MTNAKDIVDQWHSSDANVWNGQTERKKLETRISLALEEAQNEGFWKAVKILVYFSESSEGLSVFGPEVSSENKENWYKVLNLIDSGKKNKEIK